MFCTRTSKNPVSKNETDNPEVPLNTIRGLFTRRRTRPTRAPAALVRNAPGQAIRLWPRRSGAGSVARKSAAAPQASLARTIGSTRPVWSSSSMTPVPVMSCAGGKCRRDAVCAIPCPPGVPRRSHDHPVPALQRQTSDHPTADQGVCIALLFPEGVELEEDHPVLGRPHDAAGDIGPGGRPDC